MKVIHPQDAQFFMDGPEVCRQYIATEKITFGRPLCCLGRQEEPTRDTVKDMRSFIAAEDMWQSLTETVRSIMN